MRRFGRSVPFFLSLLLLPALPLHAQDTEEPEVPLESDGETMELPPTFDMPGLDWTEGPNKFPVGKIAEVQVPQGYRATGGSGTQTLLRALGNRPGPDDLATLMRSDTTAWFVVFSFEDTGYIPDEEGDDLDADELLEAIKEGTKQSNAYRPVPLTVVGWERKPAYNPQTHNLEWAIRFSSLGTPVVNFNVRVLGRAGVMSANLVVDPPDLEATLPEFRKLLAGFAYTKGNTYGEYRTGDKLAEYGLKGLIAGGALAVAVKTGLLQKFGKFILIGLVAIAAFLKKLFGGKSGGERPRTTRPRGDAPRSSGPGPAGPGGDAGTAP
jgi:uncharacterized membrane-anchored protein